MHLNQSGKFHATYKFTKNCFHNLADSGGRVGVGEGGEFSKSKSQEYIKENVRIYS